jgi:hypothetical protein
MTLGPYRVGDQPADVLDLVISRADDTAPLSGFNAAEVQIRRPDGTTVSQAGSLIQPDTVRAPWPASPFTQVGLYRVRAKLTGAGSVVEFASWVRFWVRP